MADNTHDADTEGGVEIRVGNYTQIPNILISLMSQMGEAELKVTLAIRETLGWHREEKRLSISRLCTLTGLSKQGVLNGIAAGLRRCVIGRRAYRNSFKYRLLSYELDQSACVSSQSSGPNRSTPLSPLVHEVDQSTPLTGQPNGPNQSTKLTTLVYEVDQRLVHELDTANKETKRNLKKDSALAAAELPVENRRWTLSNEDEGYYVIDNILTGFEIATGRAASEADKTSAELIGEQCWFSSRAVASLLWEVKNRRSGQVNSLAYFVPVLKELQTNCTQVLLATSASRVGADSEGARLMELQGVRREVQKWLAGRKSRNGTHRVPKEEQFQNANRRAG
jgi:hypothetical protein